MLNATVVRDFADLLPDVPDPPGSPHAGRGAERGACWGGTEGTAKGRGGGRCPVSGNGIFMEKPDGARISILSCFSLNLGKSLFALPHDTKFGSCGDCVRRLLKISSFQQMRKQ